MDERRRQVRQTVNMTGWIMRGQDDPPITCQLIDITDMGAGLRVEQAQTLPASFDLFLTENFSVGRKCVVVWRSESTVGVGFTGKIVPEEDDPFTRAVAGALRSQRVTMI